MFHVKHLKAGLSQPLNVSFVHINYLIYVVFVFTAYFNCKINIINCYTGGDMQFRMLFIEAREHGVIRKKQGLYVFGDDGKCILGATDDAAIEWMKNPKNSKVMAMIRKDTYPEMFVDEELSDKK